LIDKNLNDIYNTINKKKDTINVKYIGKDIY